jgi:hypothetical protein
MTIKRKKVIDLTITLESNYGEINNTLEQYGEQIYKREVLRGIASGLTTGTVKKPDIEDLIPVIEKWAVYTYARLLSEQIFLSITTEDREIMYAPFQCKAQYFLSKGYAGIVYSSTVFPAGKNLVLFDKQAVEPYNPSRILSCPIIFEAENGKAPPTVMVKRRHYMSGSYTFSQSRP